MSDCVPLSTRDFARSLPLGPAGSLSCLERVAGFRVVTIVAAYICAQINHVNRILQVPIWDWAFLLYVISITLGITLFPFEARGSGNMDTFDIRSTAGFSDYESVVGTYIRNVSTHPTNHICLIGENVRAEKLVWVIWQEGGRLILWEEGQSNLRNSRRQIDLAKDVVPSEGDVHGSTYLIAESWLAALRAACVTNGIELIIAGKKGSMR